LITASPAVIKNGDGSLLKLDGCEGTLLAGDKVEVKSSAIELKSGSGSGSSASTSSQDTPTVTKNLKLELTHQHFVAGSGDDPDFTVPKLADVPCRVTIGTRVITTESTNGDGVLELHVPEGVTEIEVELLIAKVTDADRKRTLCQLYGEGPLIFLVKLLTSDIPAVDDAVGKRIRLQNLGYEAGSFTSPVVLDDPDDPTASALERFQVANDLLSHEHLDTDTNTRLRKLFGR
jgi:hypothetical protein